MLNQLVGSPLLFFAVLLPVCALAAWLVKLNTTSQLLLAPVRWSAVLIVALAVFAHLYFAVVYLQSANFTDHIEPNTAIVAWIWAQGGQVYHPVDAPERYAFLYGPLAYIASGFLYKVFGASTLVAKLAGFLCLLVSLGAMAWAVRRSFPRHSYLVFVALGYFSLLALFFKNFSFWSKPDPFMVAAASIGLISCLLINRTLAAVICGLALGLAVNAKITGAVYFLPFVAWFLQRDGFGKVTLLGIVAAVLAALPFLSPSISLQNYVAWLQASGAHGLSRPMFMQNLFFMLFALIPPAIYVLRRPELLRRFWLIALAAPIALGLILVAASKPGSGPHHFLPFLPALAFLTAAAVDANRSREDSAYTFWVPLAAFLIAAAVKASFALYYGLAVVRSQAEGEVLEREIEAVIAGYPDSNIYMGYGDGSRYVTTFARTHLAWRGYPYLVDASAMMDFQLSGVEMPTETTDRILNETNAVWLIPVGQAPFTLVNYYYRNNDGMLFGDLNASFEQAYRKAGSTDHYDIWVNNRN